VSVMLGKQTEAQLAMHVEAQPSSLTSPDLGTQ
jgi:hypothetical protein